LRNAKFEPYSDGYFDPYYDGLLYLFSLLYLNGKYQIVIFKKQQTKTFKALNEKK